MYLAASLRVEINQRKESFIFIVTLIDAMDYIRSGCSHRDDESFGTL